METLTLREEIWTKVKPNDRATKVVIDILKTPIQRNDLIGIRERLRKLQVLLESLTIFEAANLYARLQKTDDYLRKLFDYELSTQTRRKVLESLKGKNSRLLVVIAPDAVIHPASRMTENKKESPQQRAVKENLTKKESDYFEQTPWRPRLPVVPKEDFNSFDELVKWFDSIYELVKGLSKDKQFLDEVRRRIKYIKSILRQIESIPHLTFSDLTVILMPWEFESQGKILLAIAAGPLLTTANALLNVTIQKEIDNLFDFIKESSEDFKKTDHYEDQEIYDVSEFADNWATYKTGEMRVMPTVRGQAIEAKYLIQLKQKGYEPLPSFFQGIDSIKGKYVRRRVRFRNGEVKKVFYYSRPDVISIKSTDSTDLNYLIRQFKNEYMKPFVVPGVIYRRANVVVNGFSKKELHLVFEDGQEHKVVDNQPLLATLKALEAQARTYDVAFKWFVFYGDRIMEGNKYIKDRQKFLNGL